MKYRILLPLIFCLLVFLLPGCAQTAAPSAAVQETVMTTAAPTTEPATEPTLSPEELFLQSLPEKQRQAYEMGIVELQVLEDAERICTNSEAAAMLQSIYRMKFGEDSWMLAHCLTEETAPQEVTRGWLMTMMFAAHGESLEELKFGEDYAANLKQLTNTTGTSYHYISDLVLRNAGSVYLKNNMYPGKLFDSWEVADAMVPAYVSYNNYGGAFRFVSDLAEFEGDTAVVAYALAQHDRTNGEKLFVMDAEGKLHFHATMTVREVVETALRYCNGLEPPVTMIPYEEMTAFDPGIITPELLNKETSLPDASCQQLPQWHGVWMTDMGYQRQQQDYQVYEFEIQAIKDAGFNMISLLCDFQWLHEPDRVPGGLNENRLKELDQVLAWCMERDIHLNLVCQHSVGWPSAFSFETLFQKAENAEPLADTWAALARRYADIPNNYLSFTMFRKPQVRNDKSYGAFFGVVADAIRRESPDRCIIADIAYGASGEAIAQYGVALQVACTWPEDFRFDYFDRNTGESTMQKASWPYTQAGKSVDGSAAMTNATARFKSPDEVADVAEQYGVGFMIGEWGPCRTYANQLCFDERFQDDVFEAYLTDMAQTMADRGYGWCYTNWFGFAGVACDFPLVQSTTYTKVPDAPLYTDDEVMGLFQKINGIN